MKAFLVDSRAAVAFFTVVGGLSELLVARMT